ncbi:MAG: aminomethyl-transferring glycine dehydrogenase subunit GcvPB, partial [Planctomycetota bacterium]|nr:aminomethyl-transferring glycine dehydrogenase subunit GcvPB [Planctomycetota bacterium]
MRLIYEQTVCGRSTRQLPACDVEPRDPRQLTQGLCRAAPAELPEVSEAQAVRHFMALSRRNHGVDNGFYPLGSCTMKYNPKANEAAAGLRGFTDLHPYVEFFRAQGTMRLLYNLERFLCAITGMRAFTLAPMAGAHGEFVGVAMIRAYHEHRGEGEQRRVMLVPDSSHAVSY